MPAPRCPCQSLDACANEFCDVTGSNDVQNVNIEKIRPIISPSILEEEAPTPAAVLDTVRNGRKAVTNLVHGRDDRLMVVVGPCSIHDPVAALDYARRLAVLKDELAQDLHIVMRVYFEKPRTTIGWKGLINDPDLDGSHNIKKGIRLARQILMDINLLGPHAHEPLWRSLRQCRGW